MPTKKKIAIIPARSGSRRILNKNIKLFQGVPIIKYSINAALQSNLFDKVIVSTDDEEISDMAKKFGADVPFLRSKETSDDKSTLGDVVFEAMNRLNLNASNTDYVCCIFATAPFLTKEFLIRSEKLFLEGSFDSFFPVLKYSYPIKRSLRLNNSSGTYEMIWPENLRTRSQDLEDAFHDTGMFYYLDTKSFLKHKSVFLKNNGCVVIEPWFAQDIDTEEDWQFAELKFQTLIDNNFHLA